MAGSITITAGFHDGTDGNDNLLTSVGEWNVALQQDRTTLYSSGARGFGGDDTISNNGYLENILFDGGAGNDSIVNGGYYHRVNNVTLLGGEGDDTIANYGDNAIINAGDGDNAIRNYGDKATILGGAGDDRIETYGDNVSITTGDGADTITSSGNDVTIDAGAGDDTVGGSGNNVTIRGGAGNDSLNGYGNSSVDSKIFLDDTIGNNYFHISQSTNATIQAGAGDDIINSDGHNKNLLINAGDGANSITSHFDNNITINAADGNDTIKFYDGTNVLINAGEGDNYIYSTELNNVDVSDITINSGAGKDTISTYGNRVLIVSGAGNDSIRHIGANSTIFGGEGDDFISNNDGGRDYSTNPSIGANNLVEGGAGNDSIYNACNNVTVNGGTGDDYISSGAVDGALLLGGDGNDSLYNTGNINREFPTNTTLNGGNGDDFIDNLGNNVTINGGTGNDTISLRTGRGPGNTYSGSENVLINYTFGDGNDFIEGFNETSTLSISGGGEFSSLISGSDVILNFDTESVTLDSAATLDALNIIYTSLNITNTANDTLITGTAFNDTIFNRGSNVTIQGFGGNDHILNSSQNITIEAGEGNDTIYNWNFNATIDAGSGDDYISNSGNNSTIDGGDGDDYIWNEFASNVTFVYSGSGNDTVGGFNTTSTVSIVGGEFSSLISGRDVKIIIGEDSLLLYDAATLNNINIVGTGFYVTNAADDTLLTGTVFNDTIINRGFNVTIQARGDNDSIYNASSNVSIDAGDGDDTINNSGGTNVTVNGGAGNDTIYNSGANVTINGGEGDDFIENGAVNVLINGGAGDDTITNYSANTTLEGGAGNDKITNRGANVTFVYNSGDGNDLIEGFNATSTLSISGGGYTSIKSGSDVVLGVDNSSITLSGAANLETLNISGTFEEAGLNVTNEDDDKTITGTADADTINNSGQRVLITSYASRDLITNSGASTAIDSGAGNDVINNSAANVTIDSGTGNDVIGNIGANNSIVSGAGNDSVDNQYGDNSTITTGEGDDTINNSGDGVYIVAGEGADSVNNSGSNVSISLGDGDDSIINSGASTAILSGDGDDSIINSGANNVTINGGQGNDYISNDSADYAVIDGGAGDDTIYNSYGNYATITDLEGNNDIQSGGGIDRGGGHSSAITTGDGNDTIRILNYANDVTVNSGGGNDRVVGQWNQRMLVNTGEGNDTIGTDGSYSTLDAGAGDDLISVIDFNSYVMAGTGNDSIYYEGSYTTIAAGDGDDTITHGTSGGYNMYLDGGKGNDLINLSSSNDTIAYAAGDGNDTIDGFNETSTLDLGGATYTSQTSGEDITITVGKGSILLIGAATLDNLNIIGEEEEGPTWHLDGTTATYGTTDDKQITLTGIKSLDGITFDGNKTVTLSASALNGKNVTITKGYTLKIDGTVPTSSTKSKAGWTSDGDEHTYTAAGTPAYYKLASNKITYTPATGGETFTLTGIASTSGVKVSGKKVTVGKAALGDSDITLTTDDGFTLALDKSVTAAKEIKSGWKKFTYTAAGTTAGYKLDGDTITHTAATGGEQFTISGLKNTNDVTVEDYVVTIGAGSLNGKAVTFSGDDFEFALGEDVPTSADEVEGKFTSVTKGTAIYRTAHTSEAYTLGDGTIEFIPAVGGNDIKIANLDKTATEEEIADAIEVVESDDGVHITFMDAAVLTTKAPTISAPKGVKYTVAVDEALSTAEETLQWKPKGTAATLSADTGATYTVAKNKVVYTKAKSGTAQAVLTGLAKDAELATPEDKVITLDAENLGTKTSLKSNAGGYEIELTGDMDGKTFVGSAAADTINIAADNALVDGGKGNDEFNISGADVTIISSAGNDTTNFADGLTVSLSGTTTVKELAQTDSGVQLTFSNKATLTVAEVTNTFEVVGKKQTFTVDTDKFALADSLTFGKSSVTVNADFTGALTPDDDIYTGGKLSTVTTIDASAVTEGISIDGNAKANYITGGEGDDTLWGGAGNDTLIGGDGSDTFIYNNGEGKDVISGFTNDDLLQITGNFTTSVNKTGTEIALKVGKGSLTLKNFTAEEFTINGEVYQISGTKLAK